MTSQPSPPAWLPPWRHLLQLRAPAAAQQQQLGQGPAQSLILMRLPTAAAVAAAARLEGRSWWCRTARRRRMLGKS